MTGSPARLFVGSEDPDYPGWRTFETSDPTRFNGAVMGRLIVRPDGETGAALRMFPAHIHGNVSGSVHGAVILALIDDSLFATMALRELGDAAASVTLDMSAQFIGAGSLDRPLDAMTEVLRETRRILFMRGLVVQDGATVASFSASVRKFEAR